MGNCSCLEFFQAKASKAPAGASESKDDDPTATVEAIFDDMRDEPGPTKLQKFRLERRLGDGAYSIVWLATHIESGTQFAIKEMPEEKVDSMEALRAEVDILRNLKHPHIIRCYDFFKAQRNYYMVTELVTGGELFDRIVQKSKYTEREARDLVHIMLNTLAYIHDADIVHRDLKPENLLLRSSTDDRSVKIADFGFAKNLRGGTDNEMCGTPGYVAPEIIRRKHYRHTVDVWSAGVIVYILLGGYPPFWDSNQKRLFKKIKHGAYEFHDAYWAHVSDDAKDLIRRMLTVDPKERITARQCLSHPWLAIDNVELLSDRDLASTMAELRKFNAKRKFRAAIRAAIATNRLQAIADSMGSK